MQYAGLDPIRDVYNIIVSIPTPPQVMDMGTTLFGYLAIIAMAWFGIKVALQGGELHNLFGNLMRQLFFVSLAYWFMPNQGNLFSSITTYGSAIATAFSGAQDPASLVSVGIQNIFEAIKAIGGALNQLITAGKPINGMMDTYHAIGRLFTYLVPVMFLALSVVMMVLMLLAYFVMWILSLGLITIAKMLSPIFIPMLVLPITQFLFDGWLRFSIVAVLYQVVGAIILQMVNLVLSGAVGKMVAVAAQTGGTANFDAAEDLAIVAILVSAVTIGLAYLLLQTGHLAQGLVSGSASFSLGQIGFEGQRVGKSASNFATSGQSAAVSVGRGVANASRAASNLYQRGVDIGFRR